MRKYDVTDPKTRMPITDLKRIGKKARESIARLLKEYENTPNSVARLFLESELNLEFRILGAATYWMELARTKAKRRTKGRK